MASTFVVRGKAMGQTRGGRAARDLAQLATTCPGGFFYIFFYVSFLNTNWLTLCTLMGQGRGGDAPRSIRSATLTRSGYLRSRMYFDKSFLGAGGWQPPGPAFVSLGCKLAVVGVRQGRGGSVSWGAGGGH